MNKYFIQVRTYLLLGFIVAAGTFLSGCGIDGVPQDQAEQDQTDQEQVDQDQANQQNTQEVVQNEGQTDQEKEEFDPDKYEDKEIDALLTKFEGLAEE